MSSTMIEAGSTHSGDHGALPAPNTESNDQEEETRPQETSKEDDDGSGPLSDADSARAESQNAEGLEDNPDDISDTGWDTDLEIEEEKSDYDVTGCKSYISICKTLGIVPTSNFVRTIQAKKPEVSLRHHGIGPKGAKAIAVALTSNTSVTHLDLSDNGLKTEGGVAVTTMLKENCYITYLDLSDNDLGSAGAYAIEAMMKSNNTLTHCKLQGNTFDDKAAEPIAEIIRTSYRITHLDLAHNLLGEQAGLVLGPALADSEVLQTLDISWNHLRRKGAVAIATGLKTNQTLKILNFSYNGLGDEGTAALADALKVNTTLEELDISNNRISKAGATVFAKALPSNDNLRILKMGQNAIQSDGIVALLNAVKAMSSTFQSISFDGLTITLEINTMLKEMKESHSHLSVLHAGVGGYKQPKPKLKPHEKLKKYAMENNVKLKDLFVSFDKEQRLLLTEEEFRNALKHISAPLLEIERQRMIKQFQKDAGEVINVDYIALLQLVEACDVPS